jgi:hypothetical protein
MAEEQKKSGSGCGKSLGIGCLVVVLILAIGGFCLAKNWRSIAGWGMVMSANAMFDGLQLPAEEKAAAMAPIRELTDKFKADAITKEQASAVLKSVFEGPLVDIVAVQAMDVAHLRNSSLPADEKQAGHKTITRFVKGRMDGTVDKETTVKLLDIISTQGPGNRRDFKESLTIEELRTCLTIMKEAADKAGVEDKEFKIDLAGEIRKAIDAGLAAKPATPAEPADTGAAKQP